MDRPYLPLFTRDWLDDIPLRSCSAASRGTLADLMCLSHEGTPYGHVAHDGAALTEQYLASRFHLKLAALRSHVAELETLGRLKRTDDGVLYVPRMVRDEELRLKRAGGGHLGGNPNLRAKVQPKVNLPPLREEVNSPSRERVRDQSQSQSQSQKTPETEPDEIARRMSDRHRKPGDRGLVETTLVGILGDVAPERQRETLDLIDARHVAWCAEEWAETALKFVPKLSNWLREGGWRDDPPHSADPPPCDLPCWKPGDPSPND